MKSITEQNGVFHGDKGCFSANQSKSESSGHASAPRDHFVQFYEEDEYLIESLASFARSGIEAAEAVIVIATPEHRAALKQRLVGNGIDVASSELCGQLVMLDAAETLSKLLVEATPDEARFSEVIGRMVTKAAKGRRGLRAFGEMVALLCADGDTAAAVRLEQLWNDLAKRCSFTLFCAYPIRYFNSETTGDAFQCVCHEHTRVIPAESYDRRHGDEDARLRTVASLQQKAAALEAEIIERKQTEKALARREQELRDFLENATEGIHKVSADGTILWANNAELELLGYTEEEYVGHPITEFHADADVIADILARLRRGEKLRDYETRMKHKDGSLRYVAISSSTYLENGECVYTKCFTRDITDRKAADTAGQLLRAIVEGSDDAIASKDLNGIVTSWNRGAERLFGYTAQEMIGQHVSKLIPPERLDEEPGIIERIRKGEGIDHYETVRRRKDGTLLDISLTVSPIRDAGGRIIGASKIARDITEQKRAKENLESTVLERTAQLRETVAELEAFSYSVAHDMRAPLRSMTSYSRFLQEDCWDALSEQGREYVRRIASASSRLDMLITDVLNYGRIARGEMGLEAVDVEKLTRDIIETYPQLQDSGAAILVQSRIPPVIGNPAALTQCISNLLSNAVKFVPRGQSPQVRVWAEKKAERVRLWVEDNGLGISPEGQKRIFHMFQRLNPAKEFDGTGIGLTIVRKAVERMGGSVGVESELGAGSRFWIELKAA
jgi:PAS domain S-box-containing protein